MCSAAASQLPARPAFGGSRPSRRCAAHQVPRFDAEVGPARNLSRPIRQKVARACVRPRDAAEKSQRAEGPSRRFLLEARFASVAARHGARHRRTPDAFDSRRRDRQGQSDARRTRRPTEARPCRAEFNDHMHGDEAIPLNFAATLRAHRRQPGKLDSGRERGSQPAAGRGRYRRHVPVLEVPCIDMTFATFRTPMAGGSGHVDEAARVRRRARSDYETKTRAALPFEGRWFSGLGRTHGGPELPRRHATSARRDGRDADPARTD